MHWIFFIAYIAASMVTMRLIYTRDTSGWETEGEHKGMSILGGLFWPVTLLVVPVLFPSKGMRELQAAKKRANEQITTDELARKYNLPTTTNNVVPRALGPRDYYAIGDYDVYRDAVRGSVTDDR